MRGRWQGSACLVPPCPGMLSQSQLLCPVPATMSGQPWAVPTTTLTGWLCHPPGPLQALPPGCCRPSEVSTGLSLAWSSLSATVTPL